MTITKRAMPRTRFLFHWRDVALLAVLAAAALAALAIDMPVARWARLTPEANRLLSPFEPFGQAFVALLIGLSVAAFDRTRRWGVPRLILCAVLAGLAADGVKISVERGRPCHDDLSGDVWQTFGGVFPGLSAGTAGQSMPSGHTAVAVGLAAGLTWLYPHAWWFAFALALGTAAQRVAGGAHYLSDVLAGATVGALIAILFLRFGLLPEWLAALERRWLGRRPDSGPPSDSPRP
jgi:membrane-associated phospholipid phosphatase